MRENKLSNKGRPVKCPKCKHEFTTRSKLILKTCNNCGAKFREKRVDRKINETND